MGQLPTTKAVGALGGKLMFNWMSQRGKNAWTLMLFLFSTMMPTIIPGIWIMTELEIRFGHPYGIFGFLYLFVTVSGVFFLWEKFYFKKKEQKEKGVG